jgi:hypothetical protein
MENLVTDLLYVPRPLPPKPTRFLPGSIQKINVMSRRWSSGYQIHHPDDAKMFSEDDPRYASEVIRDEDNYPFRREEILEDEPLLKWLLREIYSGQGAEETDSS